MITKDNINEALIIQSWLLNKFTIETIANTPDTEIYAYYLIEHNPALSKSVFTRRLKALGWYRHTKRLAKRVRNVYMLDENKVIAYTKVCAACGGKGFIGEAL